MKLNYKRVSDEGLNKMIKNFSLLVHRSGIKYHETTLDALLELKHRREEDKKHETD